AAWHAAQRFEEQLPTAACVSRGEVNVRRIVAWYGLIVESGVAALGLGLWLSGNFGAWCDRGRHRRPYRTASGRTSAFFEGMFRAPGRHRPDTFTYAGTLESGLRPRR